MLTLAVRWNAFDQRHPMASDQQTSRGLWRLMKFATSLALYSGRCVQILREAGHLDTTSLPNEKPAHRLTGNTPLLSNGSRPALAMIATNGAESN